MEWASCSAEREGYSAQPILSAFGKGSYSHLTCQALQDQFHFLLPLVSSNQVFYFVLEPQHLTHLPPTLPSYIFSES